VHNPDASCSTAAADAGVHQSIVLVCAFFHVVIMQCLAVLWFCAVVVMISCCTAPSGCVAGCWVLYLQVSNHGASCSIAAAAAAAPVCLSILLVCAFCHVVVMQCSAVL
jgi:hypothetical protein